MKNYHRLLLLLAPIIILHSFDSPVKEYTTWGKYKGSDESINYSSLRQVDTANIKTLQVAWVYRTGDADTINHSQIQCNPIIVNGVLYGTSAQMKLFAIDASTGGQPLKLEYETNFFSSIRFPGHTRKYTG